MRAKIRASMIVLLVMTAGSAGAQFQYTPPGGPPDRPENRKEALDRKVAQARYHLGPVRIEPWAAVKDVAYVRTLFNSDTTSRPSDLTATAGAGFTAYLRDSSKATWSLDVLPEYVWWRRESERRRLNGRYQLGFHGFFNRLTLEATAGREQQLKVITPEVPVLATGRADGGEVLAEVELSSAVFAFTSVALSKQTHLVDTEPDPLTRSLALLDRKERLLRGGLRWVPRRQWSVALGVEDSREDFERTALPRSNRGTSPLLQIHYQGYNTAFQAEAEDRSLNAQRGSDFVPFHQVTGRSSFVVGAHSLVRGSFYGSRDLLYALAAGYAYLQDDRVGTALLIDLGFHTSGRLFAETGHNTYTGFTAAIPHRVDDVSSIGGGIDIDLGGQVILGIQALRSRFSSNLPGADRTFSSAGFTVNVFGGR